jgi:hypothetical protein
MTLPMVLLLMVLLLMVLLVSALFRWRRCRPCYVLVWGFARRYVTSNGADARKRDKSGKAAESEAARARRNRELGGG